MIISTIMRMRRTVSLISFTTDVFIFPEELNFNLIILNDAHIRLYSMDLKDQKPPEGKGFPAYFN